MELEYKERVIELEPGQVRYTEFGETIMVAREYISDTSFGVGEVIEGRTLHGTISYSYMIVKLRSNIGQFEVLPMTGKKIKEKYPYVAEAKMAVEYVRGTLREED